MSYKPKGVFATLPHTQRGMPIVINGDPKGNNFLYCNGNAVVIRDINNPGTSDVYIEHSVQATVARYAPSGYYIASGDTSGKIRIWDTTQKEHILKYEYQPIAGKIKDIVWSPDSKRIAICGEGREKFGHVFLWDSGSSVGEIMGHSKFINAIDYRPVRPFRVVTAGEDNNVCWFEGPPFKYKSSISVHSRFVNIVRFSPDGELFCTGSADCKAFLFNGKTAEQVGPLGGDKAHSGGIYGLSWSPDGKQLLTASGDKSCKVWDVETQKVVTEFKMGTQVEDQQVSCLWQGSHLLSVSLSGSINYLDVNDPSRPIRVIRGQNKNLTSLALSSDNSTLYAGSFDGRISHWNVESGEVDLVSGSVHTNQVSCIVATPEKLYTLGLDKSFKTIQAATNEFDTQSLSLPDRDPKGLGIGSDGLAVIATLQEIIVARDGKRVSGFKPSYEPTCVSFHPSQPEVVIGGKDNKVRVYSVSGDSLNEKTTIETSDEISAIAYSPTGNFLAVTSGRSICTYDSASYQLKHTMLFHTGRAMCIAWSPDSSKIVSGGIDTNICVWDAQKGDRITMIKDTSGKIRIWDTTQKEHILKYEYQPIAGKIKDIVWSPDSKRIAICGEGREKFGHVFLWDSGSSVGEIMGHSKFINAIDYRPVRPFRVVTAGEDNNVCWFEGPPFKYKSSISVHSRFVNIVRFSPDGELFCTGSADCKAFLFNGKTAEQVGPLGGDKAHAGGIYGGQNKNLTSLALSSDNSTLYAGSFDGRISHWNVESGEVDLVSGSVHTNQVSCIVATPEKLYTLGLDKSFKTIQAATNEFDTQSLSLPDRDPKGLGIGSDGLAVIATLQEIIVARDGKRVSGFKPSYEPTCVSFHPSQPEVVIGGKDNEVRVYSVSGDSLNEKTTIETSDEISAVAYSPTGDFLAVTSGRSICTYDSASYQLKHTMLFHTGRAMCIAWSPDSSKIVSGGIDTNICVWDAQKGDRITMIKGAHPLSVVTGVVWLSNTSFASCGFDCCIRIWENSS